MKKSIFVLLVTVAALAMAACPGTQPGNGNTAKTGNSPAVNKLEFPLLASTVADAELEMIDGTRSKISDRKGKVVLVNLWATWCGPCRSEMPHLVEMQTIHADKGFQVLGLDIGDNDRGLPEKVEDIKAFATNMKLNYELARITPDLVQKFGKIANFSGVPQSFLVDREGRLRGVFLGGSPDVFSKMKSTVARVVEE